MGSAEGGRGAGGGGVSNKGPALLDSSAPSTARACADRQMRRDGRNASTDAGMLHSHRRSLTAVVAEPHGRPESESISSCGSSFMLKGSALSLASSRASAAAAGPAETRAVAGCVSEPQRGCRTATAPVPEHSGRVTGAVGTYTRRIAPKIGRETALRVPTPAAPPNVSLPPGRGARRWPTMVLQFSLVLGRHSG